MKKKLNNYLGVYLITLLCFSYFFLFVKHEVGNDSTISEWLINYEGGFTKRGLVGQIALEIARLFEANLRWVIFILQSFTYTIYFFLLYQLLKNLKLEKITILSIFTPIFILYPVAEIEVLARKEIFIFCIFLLYLFIKNQNYRNIYKIFFLSLSVLIWEPVIFYFLFFIALDITTDEFEKINKKFLLNKLYYIPAFIIAIYVALNPISNENHEIMEAYLKNNFEETCYMSCALLKSKSTIFSQFQGNFGKYSFEVFLRYFLIILIGFGPLILLSRNSSLVNTNLIFFKHFKNLFLPILIILIPILVLFAMGYDWGRWVNISYFFSIIFFLALYKNDKILINQKIFKKKYFKYLEEKKFFILILIVFCFGWNPKTVMTGDVASKPGYQIPKKAIKIVYFNLSKK